MKKLHIFTCAACNYIPKVRLLFRSLRQHHPEAVLHLALADELPEGIDLSAEPFDCVMNPSELDIPGWRGWVFCHEIVELATAIKPFYLLKLLERDDCGQVLYLDPDMVVFSRLDDILAALAEHSVALTPHLTEPEVTVEGVIDHEISVLKHGVFNLGFVGVANREAGRRFARWWGDRLYHFCRAETHNGLFTDQKWIDLVPALFDDYVVLRSPRFNVATWNLRTRPITWSPATGYEVAGSPLGFYHFTGFDSGAHRLMLGKYGADSPDANRLVNWYAGEEQKLKGDPLSSVPWRFGVYSDGARISKVERFVYRERVDLQRAFPNPFSVEEAGGFRGWMQSQGCLEYPDLFDEHLVKAELLRMSFSITPGYQVETTDSTRRLGDFAQQALKDPRFGLALLKQVWRLFRQDGVKGVMARLRRLTAGRQ